MASKSKKNTKEVRVLQTARWERPQKVEVPSDPGSIRQWLYRTNNYHSEDQPLSETRLDTEIFEVQVFRDMPTKRSSKSAVEKIPDFFTDNEFPVLLPSPPPPAHSSAQSIPPVDQEINQQQHEQWNAENEEEQHMQPDLTIHHHSPNVMDNDNHNSSTENENTENDNNNHTIDYEDNPHHFNYSIDDERSNYHSFEDFSSSTTSISQDFVDLESIQQELTKLEDLMQNGFIQEDDYQSRKEKLVALLPSNAILSQPVEVTEQQSTAEDVNTIEGKDTIEEDYSEQSEEEEEAPTENYQPELTEPVESTFTELSAMELLKQKMVEKGSATIDKVNLDTLLSQTRNVQQNTTSESSSTIRQYSFMPLIVHGDLSRLNCDVLVLPTGCFVTSGVMDSMTTRYGKYLPQYLRKKFNVGRYPTHLPQYKYRTAKDFQNLKAMGGLTQGFSAWITSDELRPFAEDKTIPPIVVSIVGGDYDGQITVDSISAAVKNVFKVVNSHVSPNKSITVAFPAFGIGKGSLSRDRVPALYSQIEAMFEGHRQYPHMLPVLVTYSDTIQRLALAARTKFFQSRGDKALPRVLRSDTEMAVIPELQSELEADRLALFVGAGVSLAAGLPSWAQFVQNLAGRAGLKLQKTDMTTEDLLNVSEQAKQMLGSKFGTAFRESLGYFPNKFNPGPSLTHYYAASLSKSIVTTNYDDLIEQALANMKKAAFVINTPQDVARVPMGEQVNVLKIHGDITNPSESVLTRSDYESYFAKRPAVSTMLKGLLLNRTFLFIGYSLRDLNLQIILNEVSQMLRDARRPAFAVVFESTDSERQYWAERGVQLLTVTGDSSRDKAVSLWQFLDVLQMKYFAPHGAWLAEDASDLFPERSAFDLDSSMSRLRSSIFKLLADWERDPTPELADFLFPFLMTASKHGLSISRDSWNLLAKHYANRTPATEVTHLMALSAAIAALQQSGGRAEHQHRDYLHQLQKEFMK